MSLLFRTCFAIEKIEPCKLTDEEVVNLQGTLLHDLHGQKSSAQWVHTSCELNRGLLIEWNRGAEDVLRQSVDPTASHVVVPDTNFRLLEQTKNLVKATYYSPRLPKQIIGFILYALPTLGSIPFKTVW